jgi:hypothetical protein
VLDPRGGDKGTEDVRSVLNIVIHEQEARRDIYGTAYSAWSIARASRR